MQLAAGKFNDGIVSIKGMPGTFAQVTQQTLIHVDSLSGAQP